MTCRGWWRRGDRPRMRGGASAWIVNRRERTFGAAAKRGAEIANRKSEFAILLCLRPRALHQDVGDFGAAELDLRAFALLQQLADFRAAQVDLLLRAVRAGLAAHDRLAGVAPGGVLELVD